MREILHYSLFDRVGKMHRSAPVFKFKPMLLMLAYIFLEAEPLLLAFKGGGPMYSRVLEG